MMYNKNDEDGEGDTPCHIGPMKKGFKLAVLDKKEKILKAKIEFIEKMKKMVNKIPEDKK